MYTKDPNLNLKPKRPLIPNQGALNLRGTGTVSYGKNRGTKVDLMTSFRIKARMPITPSHLKGASLGGAHSRNGTVHLYKTGVTSSMMAHNR